MYLNRTVVTLINVAAQHPTGMHTVKYILCVYGIALFHIDFIVISVIDNTCCQMRTLNCPSCCIINKRSLENKLEEPAVANKVLFQFFCCCLGFRASYVNIYKENQLDAV